MIYTGLNNTEGVDAVYLSKRLTFSGTPPLSFPSKGYDLEDYTISGNTIQDGTPTPEVPVDVLGCGEWDITEQQYKLPISVNGTEYPIYLGQVPTTRIIKKLVLTGDENWKLSSTTNQFYMDSALNAIRYSITCTHFVGVTQFTADNQIQISASLRINIRTTYIRYNLTDWINYLQQQYANGTPVIIWYILAEPEPGIVNEPLMELGNYADTVSMAQSGITIPTTKGENILTVPTTVLPSSVSITTPSIEVAEVYGDINYQKPIYYKKRTLIGVPPLTYKALSNPLSDYHIVGATIQDGTPTTEAPVDVVGCGVKTGNLFSSTVEQGTTAGGALIPSSSRVRSGLIYLGTGRFTFSCVNDYDYQIAVDYHLSDGKYSSGTSWLATNTFELTNQTPIVRLKIRHPNDSSFLPTDVSNIMLNLGSAALPYEPYGYKLSPTINGTEYPIYLGEVQSTRKIKKLVFTGNENWSGSAKFRIPLSGQIGTIAPICTHYRGVTTASYLDLADGRVTVNGGINLTLCIYDSANQSSLDAWKSYLAAQYAAGTPVTVWYVLATPETAVVNEPLMKIGDYADTVSFAQAGVSLPTTAGTNQLTVDTTVNPSEVSITGNIKPTGYGQLLDVNNVEIYDKNGTPIFIQG